MKKLLIFGSFLVFFGNTYANDSMERNVLMGKLPTEDDEATRYVRFYKKDISDCMGLQVGILASQYYINKGANDKAAELLATIVPTVFSVIDSDFFTYFVDRISCAGKMLSTYITNGKNISQDDIETILRIAEKDA